ncbi:MAG: amidohydrolase family protein [Firmicutes bacterium]|nr:amidohydrolase family protein [Bacillota bacterium]
MAFGFFKKKEAYADRVFYNGHFYTMDPEVPWVDAVAVRDGKVMAVGSYSQMEDILADDTERVDLREKYVYPGFIDIHHSPVMKMMDENYTIVEEETEEAEEAEAKNIFASLEHAEVYEYLEDEEDGQVTVEVDAGEALGEDGGIVFEVEEEGEPAEELDDETEYFVDNSEFTAKVKETMESLSDHGYTAVLNLKTPNQIENEFTDSLIELYTEDQLRARFFGALYMNRPVPARLVKEVLSMRRTKCTEVGDMIRNEVLHLELDSDAGHAFPQSDLNDMLTECSDRGFILFIEAVGHDDLLKAYKAVDYVRNKGYKNNIVIMTDEELTDEEESELSYNGSAYWTWRSDVMGRSFFDGNIRDPEDAIEHLTMEAAELLGAEDVLGSIEKGKYADFSVFSENLLEKRPSEFGKLYCDMTIVNGEIVHDVEAENDEYMLNMMLYSR